MTKCHHIRACTKEAQVELEKKPCPKHQEAWEEELDNMASRFRATFGRASCPGCHFAPGKTRAFIHRLLRLERKKVLAEVALEAMLAKSKGQDAKGR